MEEFLGPVTTLLGALGFPLLQPLPKAVALTANEDGGGPRMYFRMPKRTIDAQGQATDEGFVVFAGSVGDAEVRHHLGKGYRALRQALIDDGTLVQEGAAIRLKRDFLFSSASAAAAVLAGGAFNGREAWRDSTGKTLKELEDLAAGVA